MGTFTIRVKHELTSRRASDELAKQPVATLHELLGKWLPEGSKSTLTPPPPTPDEPQHLEESDLPLPPHLSIAEAMDEHRTEGQIEIDWPAPFEPRQVGMLEAMMSKACSRTEIDSRWFHVIPPV